MDLGEKISSLRKSKGLSQELLAENARVSLRTIQRIEKGDTVPRPYTLKIIADSLNVPLAQLAIRLELKREDIAKISQINLSTLMVLLLPILHIILPILLWEKHRSNEIVSDVARRIIGFQILWTVAAMLVIVAAQLLQITLTGSVMSGRYSVLYLVYFPLLCLNIFFTVRTTLQLKNNLSSKVYSFVPALF